MTISPENENITKPTLRRLTREEAPAVIDAWRSSGLSAAAFGATIDVSGQNIYQWASDFRKAAKRELEQDASPDALQRVCVKHAHGQDELRGVKSSTAIMIIMELPPRIMVSSDADEATLRCVLRALSS